jgi:hypothetical protein
VPAGTPVKKEKVMIDQQRQRRPTAAIPPLDALTPVRTETATFALG